MGFSIGKFIGGLAPAIGGLFGPIGGAIGGGIGAAFAPDAPARAATVGRQLTPGPVSPGPSFNFSGATFGGPAFRPTSIGPTAASFIPQIGRIIGGGLAGAGITKMFEGGGANGNPISRILAKARQATGGPVTRNKIIDAAKVCGLEVAAETFGLDVREVCMVVVKGRSRRRRGVSAADIRRTKRTIGFASKIRKDLKVLAR